MSTIGLRGVFAAVLIVSTGFLGGMSSMSSGVADGGSSAQDTFRAGDESPGLVQRFKRKACKVSLAATRRDTDSGVQRSKECLH